MADFRRRNMMRVRVRGPLLASLAPAAAALTIVLMLMTTAAQPTAQPAPAPPPDGASLYKVYCASCHGASARGDGAVAQYLKYPAADLTRIASRANGVFPSGEVFKIIDGRQRVGAHGDSAMPVWGDGFTRVISGSSAADNRARIEALVKYLEGIQMRQASNPAASSAVAR
jgi:mono/diheme cytochrome c family protein